MTPPLPMPPAIPAATLVILRDSVGGPPDLLMVERARGMAFAAGALVFPGGRIDPGDHDLAARFGDDSEDGAARAAAIRETIEEAGLPIALDPMPSPTDLDRLRGALHAGEAFGAALDAIGARITPDLLEPFARWRPAHAHARIFDTRFYIARLPADAPAATVDRTENVRLLWATAQAVLDAADAGTVQIIFPTRRNLERLARHARYDDAVADARARPVRTVTPWAETRDGVEHLCIPDDLGYPITSQPLSDAVRG